MTYCRSPQEIRDDNVVQAHTEIQKLLNTTCNGRCLYVGKTRENLLSLLNEVEACILGGTYPMGIHERIYRVIRTPLIH